MSSSVGATFPSGVNPGHTHYNPDSNLSYEYIGGNPALLTSWELLDNDQSVRKGASPVFGSITLDKTTGNGIKVDKDFPTFGWRDILGNLTIKSAGANDPVFAVYRNNLRQFQFSNLVFNEVFFEYHIPHDYVPNSDIFIHTHWSQIIVDTGGPAGIPGISKWSFDISYAKGHNQAAFIAPITTFVTQQASGTQYQHMLAEIQISATSPTSVQLDSSIIEPDGIIVVRCFRDPADAADTLDQAPFVHYIDIHYQSTNIATKQKAPNFYI